MWCMSKRGRILPQAHWWWCQVPPPQILFPTAAQRQYPWAHQIRNYFTGQFCQWRNYLMEHLVVWSRQGTNYLTGPLVVRSRQITNYLTGLSCQPSNYLKGLSHLIIQCFSSEAAKNFLVLTLMVRHSMLCVSYNGDVPTVQVSFAIFD